MLIVYTRETAQAAFFPGFLHIGHNAISELVSPLLVPLMHVDYPDAYIDEVCRVRSLACSTGLRETFDKFDIAVETIGIWKSLVRVL